ncbi:MAG: 1-acyl-sn-glycerol-3-phosphate acyltransferase [Anaerolineae bacterium]|nr:1-acyl-sn-glycerol-3-phosphate acyltransferase [Anaerolineae bacterium]
MQPQHRLRQRLRPLGRLLQALLTRTTVTGLEHVPQSGAAIYAANHASTYDPIVLMMNLPPEVYAVGPGDFRLLFPANLVVEKLGVIRIQRGEADRDSLKAMLEVLKAGHQLALFPEGGTWEKRLDDVKPGAAYLSLMTGAVIVPIAIGGSYQVWRELLRLRRPRITLHILPPLGPITSTDRKRRAEDLRAASLDLMQRIYDHLPPEEQARYDRHARAQFSAYLEADPPWQDVPAADPNNQAL